MTLSKLKNECRYLAPLSHTGYPEGDVILIPSTARRAALCLKHNTGEKIDKEGLNEKNEYRHLVPLSRTGYPEGDVFLIPSAARRAALCLECNAGRKNR